MKSDNTENSDRCFFFCLYRDYAFILSAEMVKYYRNERIGEDHHAKVVYSGYLYPIVS